MRAVVRGGGGGGGGIGGVAGGVLQPRARHIPPIPHLQLHQQHAPQHAQLAKEAEERGHNEEEWKNINVMLNCVLSMVEKTKHALAILQQRSTSAAEAVPQENGVGSGLGSAGAAVGVSRQVKAAVDDILARTLQDTEERIAELKRRAEEAVNEVRRQAVLEIQRAVAAAEAQAAELVAAERASLERRLAPLAAVPAVPAVQPLGALQALQALPHNGHSPPVERIAHAANSCWNCGRKAHETCSGCNVARYCGSFCQHKDWETHHQVCRAGPGGSTSVPDSASVLWAGGERGSTASAPPGTGTGTGPAPRPSASPPQTQAPLTPLTPLTPLAPLAQQLHGALAAMVAVSKTSPQK